MLGNVTCWAIAMSLLLTQSYSFTSDCIKLLFVMGFILMANICKFVDVYRDTHSIDYENVSTSDSSRK